MITVPSSLDEQLRRLVAGEVTHAGVRLTTDAMEARSWSHQLVEGSSRTRGLDPTIGVTLERLSAFEDAAHAVHEAELARLRRGAVASDVIITESATLAYAPAVARQRELSRAGERVRYSRSLPRRMSIFEERIVLLERGSGLTGALLVTDEILVHVLIDMFEGYWARSSEWRPDAIEHDPDVRARVVAMMSAGLVDDAIARRLEMSPRTVARIVSALMREHNCTTRFQLGAALHASALCTAVKE